MINPYCPPDIELKKFIAKKKYFVKSLKDNSHFYSIEDRRTSLYFTKIILNKVNQLGYKKGININILNVCGGSGFEAFHLKKIFPESKITIIDISQHEIMEAKKKLYKSSNIKFVVGDFLTYKTLEKYDLIIGNSFLHHFPNVPKSLQKIYNLLSNKGFFINLHEPSEKADFVESIGQHKFMDYVFFLKRIIFLQKNNVRKYDKPLTDLWLFNQAELYSLLEKTGFSNVVVKKTGFFRTVVEHVVMVSQKNVVSKFIEKLLLGLYKIDDYILNKMGFQLFNSYFFIASKND